MPTNPLTGRNQLSAGEVDDLYRGIYGNKYADGLNSQSLVDEFYSGMYGSGNTAGVGGPPSTRTVQAVSIGRDGRPAQQAQSQQAQLSRSQLDAIRAVPGRIPRLQPAERLVPGRNYDSYLTRPETAAEAAAKLAVYNAQNLGTYDRGPFNANGYVAQPKPMVSRQANPFGASGYVAQARPMAGAPMQSLTATNTVDPGLGGLYGEPMPSGIAPQRPPNGMAAPVFADSGSPAYGPKPVGQRGNPLLAIAGMMGGGQQQAPAGPPPPPAGIRSTAPNGYVYATDGRGGQVQVGTTRAQGVNAAQQYEQANARARASQPRDNYDTGGGGGGRSLSSSV